MSVFKRTFTVLIFRNFVLVAMLVFCFLFFVNKFKIRLLNLLLNRINVEPRKTNTASHEYRVKQIPCKSRNRCIITFPLSNIKFNIFFLIRLFLIFQFTKIINNIRDYVYKIFINSKMISISTEFVNKR